LHDPPLAADPPTVYPVPVPHPLVRVPTGAHASGAIVVELHAVEQPVKKLTDTGPQVEPSGGSHEQPH
jgi:hypothetical protein